MIEVGSPLFFKALLEEVICLFQRALAFLDGLDLLIQGLLDIVEVLLKRS